MSGQCRVLMYHWFRREGEPSKSRSPQLEITPELFAEQMQLPEATEIGFPSSRLARAKSTTGALGIIRSRLAK